MRSGALPVAGWGLAVAGLAVFGWLAFGLGTLPTLVLAGAGVAATLAGLLAAGAEHRHPRARQREELLVEASWASVALAVGVTLALVGVTAFGPALFWPGVGLILVAGLGLVREQRAGRRLLAAAGMSEPEARA